MSVSVWGVEPGCVCSAQGDHVAGACPDGCLCQRCACTCGIFCTLGHLSRGGGCRCGCVLHNHRST